MTDIYYHEDHVYLFLGKKNPGIPLGPLKTVCSITSNKRHVGHWTELEPAMSVSWFLKMKGVSVKVRPKT